MELHGVVQSVGNPAVTFPFGRSNEGLPIGVQIVARPWQEELVLSVAAELEAQRGPWQAPNVSLG
jgi:amidase